MLTDSFGNAVSTRNTKSLDLFNRAVTQFNFYRIDPVATIDSALAEDPGFVLGQCFKAGLLCTTTERGMEPVIASCIEAAEGNSADATLRERMYIAAVRAWLRRDFARFVKLFGDIVVEHPRDLLALQFAHLGDFFLGQSSMLRDRPAQVLPAWGEDDPARGFVLGMHAFGLEECGQYAQAEVEGRRAVELNPGDGWGVHAVAHVFEMQGRTSEGIQWLESNSAPWSEQSFFAYHNWWHLALYHTDCERYDAALRVYDTQVRTSSSRVAMEMIDASALLWRLRLRGVDVGNRWEELAQSWEGFGEDGYYSFNDVHAVMAFLATGRTQQVRRILSALETAAQGRDTNAAMSREVGLPLARALDAFERKDYPRAIDDLSQIRGIAQRFGGSHAQRDLIQLTLMEAALRAGRRSLARALTSERLALKPRSPFNLHQALKAA
jgi:hypothetical protein